MVGSSLRNEIKSEDNPAPDSILQSTETDKPASQIEQRHYPSGYTSTLSSQKNEDLASLLSAMRKLHILHSNFIVRDTASTLQYIRENRSRILRSEDQKALRLLEETAMATKDPVIVSNLARSINLDHFRHTHRSVGHCPTWLKLMSIGLVYSSLVIYSEPTTSSDFSATQTRWTSK